MDEVKDTFFNALKANLKGVTVLTSIIENVEDGYLSDHDLDEYFAEEVDEVVEKMKEEEMKEEEKEQKEEESEDKKLEEKKNEETEASGEEEKEQQEEKITENEEKEKLEEEGLATDVAEVEKEVDVMGIVMELNGEVGGDE
ncbi:uncharacterized protein LOC125818938 [Solanum verrucosum]|uniref:uncharacterized protein LOC125818938 n=1 Tax=Solanum verrucosum TaxID=315347 RepID=UPI0020D135EB|nr:uncharacterized protein LOC125818938 [Solanum verrucosum]